MEAVRMGPVRIAGRAGGLATGVGPATGARLVTGCRPATGVALAATLTLAGCSGPASDATGSAAPGVFHRAYAEIVAEEDARGREGLAQVLVHLEGSEPTVRAVAARALGRLEDARHLPRLESPAADPEPAVRIATAHATAQMVFGRDPGSALPALLDRLQEEANPAVLGALASALGRIETRTPDAQEAAATGLGLVAERLLGQADGGALPDPELAGRMGLARGLEAFARQGAPPLAAWTAAGRALAVLADSTRERDAARIRRLAVAALARAGALPPELARSGAADSDWGVRRQVLVAAARSDADRLGPALAQAVNAGLADPDPRVRVEAQRAYDRHLRPQGGCGPILDALADPNPHVSATAAGFAARPCPNVEAQQAALLERLAGLDGPDVDWRGPAQALVALASLAPEAPETPPGIARLASHGSPFARAWAARAAAQVGDEATLRRLAGDPDFNARTAALEGLGTVAGTAAWDVYAAQLDAPDPLLVMTAARLLTEHAAPAEATPPDAATPDSDARPTVAPARTATPAMLTALDRFTATGRETVRDVRLALLDGIDAAGGASRTAIEPYLADFDLIVAARATALVGPDATPRPQPLPRAAPPDAARLTWLEGALAVLRMEGLGDIVIALRPDLAATNAHRFARLVEEGYFDGLTFHRVEPNFVIQGGSPHANEYAGDGPYTRDEISAQPHWRGTVGLSTRGRDTGDAQIFVNLVDNVRLDFNYTIFGEVVEGMDVVDAVQEGAVILEARLAVEASGRAAR